MNVCLCLGLGPIVASAGVGRFCEAAALVFCVPAIAGRFVACVCGDVTERRLLNTHMTHVTCDM